MSMHAQAVDIGVDIGGTFTDIVCRRPGQPMHTLKIPTSRGDPSQAVLDAVRHLSQDLNVAPSEIQRFLHGTTIATNAVLERKGAKIGLITSIGFKDTLEIGSQLRQELHRVLLKPVTPGYLAPGAQRKEVIEQVSAQGEVVTPLDEESVRLAVAELIDDGVEAIAVCYVFSFLHPRHEQRTRELIDARHHGIAISLSSEVDPTFREYERTLVTAFDAYMKPIVGRYLERLHDGLAAAQVSAPLQIMQSRGGLTGTSVARKRPVRLFLSGPAAGVIGGAIAGRSSGHTDLITIDVGGTSSDIALVEGGQPVIRAQGMIAGFPVRVPMVDVNAIGAGGGSIAWIDGAGGLRVGPHSAGSEPGPACYGRGGQEATVTDASVVLGWLDPEYFAGGTVPLDPALARAGIEQHVARPLGLSIEDAALGIHRVVNAQMVEGIRLVSVRRGLDPRRFTLVALGGAGPIHASALATELSIGKVLIPRHPGVLSAAGLLAAPIEHEVATAFPRELATLDIAEIRHALDGLDRQCSGLMAEESIGGMPITIQYSADIWYVGQSYHLEVPVALDAADPLRALYQDFLALHDRIYGHAMERPAAIVNLRSVHRAGGSDHLDEEKYCPSAADPVKSPRIIRVAGNPAPVQAAIYLRAAMPPGMIFSGPAIVEQADTTTLVEPGWHGTVLGNGNLLLARG
ncbi:hydantoinase/oxoprolinase family protein [Rhodopila sp.]|uniref:hydantoinase/oxoprolinase family protein n=1 Tax=Rhodopila sp. TaxID=2480087 RepID=UPI003D0C5764